MALLLRLEPMARRHARNRRSDEAPGWVWMLFGLSLGLIVAFGVYLAGREDRTAAPSAGPPAAATAPAPAPAERSSEGAGTAAASPQPVERRFDFYEILPELEVVVPEAETRTPGRTGSVRPAPPPKAVEEPGSYVLQAGSFTSLADADRMQASLALLGIESRIQRVTIDDAVFHRVRIGPISDLDELNRIRSQLHDARIEPLVMKAR
ncbi:MAG TPA: SPOR domain-containing protein [Gammaproteobacteria bacterium]